MVFDAYGTLYDVHSVYAKTEELCPGKGDLITQIWRLKQLGDIPGFRRPYQATVILLFSLAPRLSLRSAPWIGRAQRWA